MLAGVGMFGLLDAISKTLAGESHTVWQVLLVRFATILAVVALLRRVIRGWAGRLPRATRASMPRGR
jgi:ABC-type branched-subunit amino acid transport system permease subunit